MVYNLDKVSYSVYSLYCHIIQAIKYRRKVFTNDAVVGFLKTREIAYTTVNYVIPAPQ
jgi:REP element-mobilizing transposase RayT